MCPIETLIHNFTKIQTLTEKEKGFLSQQKIQHKIQQFFKRILQLVKNDLIILLAINYLTDRLPKRQPNHYHAKSSFQTLVGSCMTTTHP